MDSETQSMLPGADAISKLDSLLHTPAPFQPHSNPIPTKYPVADYQQLAKLRVVNMPSQLRGRYKKSVRIFYNSFVDFNRIYRAPLKILDDVCLDRLDNEDENLYPTGICDQDPQLYDDYSSVIYARLKEEGVLDPQDPLNKGLLEQLYNSRRDGYALLKGILAATAMVQSKDLGALSTTPPQPQPGSTPHTCASRLSEFFRGQQRIYKDEEQAMMYLQEGTMREPTYTAATQQLLYEL